MGASAAGWVLHLACLQGQNKQAAINPGTAQACLSCRGGWDTVLHSSSAGASCVSLLEELQQWAWLSLQLLDALGCNVFGSLLQQGGLLVSDWSIAQSFWACVQWSRWLGATAEVHLVYQCLLLDLLPVSQMQ